MKHPRKLTPKKVREIHEDEETERELKDAWRDPVDIEVRDEFGIQEDDGE
jgi:hypothetical protein